MSSSLIWAGTEALWHRVAMSPCCLGEVTITHWYPVRASPEKFKFDFKTYLGIMAREYNRSKKYFLGRNSKGTWKIHLFSWALLPCVDYTSGGTKRVFLYDLKVLGLLSCFFSLKMFRLLMQQESTGRNGLLEATLFKCEVFCLGISKLCLVLVGSDKCLLLCFDKTVKWKRPDY